MDGEKHTAILVERPLTTFESETYLLSRRQLQEIGHPAQGGVEGLCDGRLLVNLREDWTVDKTFRQGSLVDLDLAAASQDPEHLKPGLVYAPGPRESLEQTAPTRDALVVITFDNVRGRAFVYRHHAKRGWTRTKIDLPDNSTLGIADTDIRSGMYI